MSIENDKKIEVLRAIVAKYFSDMDKYPAEDTMFTIDEILDDQNIIGNAHLYSPDTLDDGLDDHDFDVCMG